MALVSYASIADSLGDLLFYAAGVEWDTFGVKVWNRNHLLMQNGDSIGGHPNRGQCCLIIPNPSSSNLYYLFTIQYKTNSSSNIFYSLIDMSMNGGLGAVTQKNILIFNDSLTEHFSAVKHANGRDWWLVLRRYVDNKYYKLLVSSNGINGPYTQNIGYSPPIYYGEMEFSKQGNKMVIVSPYGYIDLYDFDRCTGNLSNYVDLGEHISTDPNYQYYGCAFSPNETKLYVSTSPININMIKHVVQYDLISANIMASKQIIYTYADTMNFVFGQMQLAPDGKIYISKSYGYGSNTNNVYDQNLDYITDPNASGAACNYCSNCFSLQGHGLSKLGLPNNPNYNLRNLIGSPCDTLDVGIEENYFANNNYSIYPNPFHDKATLSLSEYCSSCTLEIYDALGQKVTSKNFSGWQTEINRSTMKSGIYFFSVSDRERTIFTGKLIVEK